MSGRLQAAINHLCLPARSIAVVRVVTVRLGNNPDHCCADRAVFIALNYERKKKRL